MRRFFLTQPVISSDELFIEDPQVIKHISVLRLGLEDKLQIFDDTCIEYICRINKIEPQRIVCVILSKNRVKHAVFPRITLACAIPKKSKFDFIIEKTTELGVSAIIPLITERTIVRLSKEALAPKTTRWQRIAREASEQSAGFEVPQVRVPVKVLDLIKEFKSFDSVYMLHVGDQPRTPITEILPEVSSKKEVLVLIGPEGDFTPSEVSESKRSGARMVSMGSRILKVETAAIMAVGIISILSGK